MTVPPDKSPDKISTGKPIEPVDKPIVTKQPTGFDTHMQKTAPGMQGTPPSGPTPMDLARGTAMAQGAPSINSISAQARNAQDSLGTVEQQLKDKNLKLKRSQALLVKQKLTDAQTHINAAGSKMGIAPEKFQMQAGTTGITQFLAYVNDGQNKLVEVQEKLKELSAKGDQMSPGDMMTIQVKMGLAQQEIEYTSTLLGKVIDSIKQLMNVQL